MRGNLPESFGTYFEQRGMQQLNQGVSEIVADRYFNRPAAPS